MPTTSLVFEGFSEFSLSFVAIHSLPMRSWYSRPNCARTLRRASSIASRFAGTEKSVYGSLWNSGRFIHYILARRGHLSREEVCIASGPRPSEALARDAQNIPFSVKDGDNP